MTEGNIKAVFGHMLKGMYKRVLQEFPVWNTAILSEEGSRRVLSESVRQPVRAIWEEFEEYEEYV